MKDYVRQNKSAWEFNVYDFWVEHSGTPAQRARKDLEDPAGMLKKYAAYFDSYEGIRVANICGSCGKKAIPLAILGAEATVFDISEDNRRYALETAEAAGVSIDFVLGDVLEADMEKYGGYFDVVFMEGGILHYFHDIRQFMDVMFSFLRPGGRMIASDFHPFQKVFDILDFEQPTADYFSTEIIRGEMAHARYYPEEIRKQFPLCEYRKYTMSEIINAVIGSGFLLKRFDEHPAWTDPRFPGEFTILAVREAAAASASGGGNPNDACMKSE